VFVEFVCKNIECDNYKAEEVRMIYYSEIDNQLCACCGLLLQRMWSFKGAIKTNDGFKSSTTE
jgi:hypothetical protein